MASGSAQMSDADYFNYISAAILQAKKLNTSECAGGDHLCSRDFDGGSPYAHGTSSSEFCSHAGFSRVFNPVYLGSRLSKN